MKRTASILIVLLTLVSCQTEPKSYEITGSIEGVEDGKKVTLRTFKEGKPIEVDTTSIKSGKFTMIGSVEDPDIHLFQVENVNGVLPFILENKKLKVTLYKDSLGVSKIEGSEENLVARKYLIAVRNFKLESDALRMKLSAAQQKKDSLFLQEFNAKNLEIRNRNNKHNIEFIKAHNDKLFVVLILENLVSNNAIKINEANDLFNNLPLDLQKSLAGLRIKKKIDAALSTELGSIAPNFSAPSTDGKEISLNDVKGKVTIIDFWAAWCGPCRRENPNLVKVYNKYHDKGLEIIGVSLDGSPRQRDAKKDWMEAIEKDGLTWHQVSNLNYFNDPVAKKYNIQSIPATFILDSDLKIIYKNLRGPALEKTISELLD